MSIKNFLFFVIVLVLAFVGTGCASAQTRTQVPRPGRWENSAVGVLGASQLPPTVPYKMRSVETPNGGSFYERRSDVYVGKIYDYDYSRGTVTYSNVVYSYSYTNSYRYTNITIVVPQTYDAPTTIKSGTIFWPGKSWQNK